MAPKDRVFVHVVGFEDAERHALNAMFRLSAEHAVQYLLWLPDAPELPRLGLLDGSSGEAPLALSSPALQEARLLWVGPNAPAHAWRRFERPIAWPEVLAAMDELFAPPPVLDVDLDFDGLDTLPPTEDTRKRALIASADREARLYWRARLALSDWTWADEASSATEALAKVQAGPYALTVLDLALGDGEGWDVLHQLAQERGAGRLVLTRDAPGWRDRLRAWRDGIGTVFAKAPPQAAFDAVLRRA